MGIQLLFCIESNKRARTDWAYIEGTVKYHFSLSPEVSIKPIFMGGKTHFRDPSVLKQIKDYERKYSRSGITKVVYCIDTDNFEQDPDRKKEFDRICDYCNENGYELIWFCRDVEEVYWGERIESGEKLDRAKKFNRTGHIAQISEEALKSNIRRKGRSNILNILSKFLEKID